MERVLSPSGCGLKLTACPGDVLVEKTTASAFFPGPLPELLEERGVDTVLISGTVTNVCCESSAQAPSGPGRPAYVRARVRTVSSIASVTRPVKVFCWLGW
ncbi:hypothetical protein GCM10023191_010900 [Actinoallomurus oryzae]|uniref:Isochorismatase-like domain-containing protein n=1 Tax=Actinoallomurus oryzae TaxID=502180 RepID=A0ABP8PGE0_9ACTN